MASATKQKTEGGLLPSSFKFYNFHGKAGDKTFDCEIIKMEDCLYVWIGDKNNSSMQDLSLALSVDFFERIARKGSSFIGPHATKILGDFANDTSLQMAKSLSRMFRKSVYVSFNITVSYWAVIDIEKRIRDVFFTHRELLNV